MANILNDLKKSEKKLDDFGLSTKRNPVIKKSKDKIEISKPLDAPEESEGEVEISQEKREKQVLSEGVQNITEDNQNSEYIKSAPAFIPNDNNESEPDTTDVFTGREFMENENSKNINVNPQETKMKENAYGFDSEGDSVYQEFLRAKQKKLDEKRMNETIPRIEVQGEKTHSKDEDVPFSGVTKDFVGNFKNSELIHGEIGGAGLNNSSFNDNNMKIDAKIESFNKGSDFLSDRGHNSNF